MTETATPTDLRTDRPVADAAPASAVEPFWTIARREIRETMILGLPLVAAQLVQILLATTDTIMAGQVSPHDLAYVALGGSLWYPMSLFGLGTLLVVNPTVSQLYGAGDHAKIGSKVHQGLWLAMILGAFTLCGVQFAEPVLRWNHVEPSLIPGAIAFLKSICWGLPALFGQVALRGLSEGVSRTRPLLVIALLAFPLNIFGNWVFINGHFGLPKLGGVGCGVATAIVLWVDFALMLAWVRWYDGYSPYRVLRQWEWPHWSEIRALFRLGIPIGVALFMECTLFAAGPLLLGQFGENVVAAHQSALNVASVTFMIPLGFSTATSIRVGQAVGRRDAVGVRRAGFTGILLCAAIMVVNGALLATIPGPLASLYTREPEVAGLMAQLLFLAAIFQVFDGVQVSSNACLRGLKDTAVPAAITVVAYWAIGIPLAYWLAIHRGQQAVGVWVAFIAALGVAAALLALRFDRKSRRVLGDG